jgi:hypothetical protein
LRFGQDANQKGFFDEKHIVFAGINNLYEGITICYPNTPGKLTTLATGTDGKTCIACMERSDKGGRVIVDTGFTKLYCNWNSAGQARYVINATVFLVDIEGRFGDDETTEKEEKK